MPEYKKKQFQKEKLLSPLWFKNYMLVIMGAFVLAVGYTFFMIPHNIVPGGVFGSSIIINHLIGLPIGIISLCINIPLLLLGIKILGAKFGVKTFLAMVISSASIDLLSHFWGDINITDDLLVSAIFGGVLIGAGIAMVIRAEATTGGTDIIAQILAVISKRQVGQMFLIIDGLIVFCSVIIFRKIELAPYAVIAIFCISRTVDTILNGLEVRKAVFIISQQHEKIREYILSELDRGGTYLNSRGLYFPEHERNLIFSVLNRKELAQLQNWIKAIDPDAFLTVFQAQEIFGSGFKPFK